MASPKPIPFDEWRPDLSDRANPASEAKGVVSIGGQYGPFPSLSDYNGAMAATAATCVGAGAFYDSLLLPHIYLGSAALLYHLESRIAVDRSQGAGYALLVDDVWQFAQFGDSVVAVAATEDPQLHNMLTPTVDFVDLDASAPTGATNVARVNDFLFLAKDFTAHWSAFNDPTDFTPSSATQAGNQELDQEQGVLQQVVGLDYAALFQERAIRRAIYVGPPVVWDFGQDAVEKDRGAISRNAAAPWGRRIFFVADDGFYVFDGQTSVPIGEGKVDDYFTRRLNYGYRHRVRVACVNKRFIVGFPAGGSTNISELLIFNMQDGRWTHDEVDLEVMFAAPPEALTVDSFHTLYTSDDLDDPAITPDDIDSGVFDSTRRLLAGTQLNHRLGFFVGPNRPAIIETGEFEIEPGRRTRLRELWPLGDFQQGAVSASIGYRSSLPGAAIAYTNPTAMNRAGFCAQNVDARFMRGRLNIAGGAAWRRAEGFHQTSRPSGRR